MSKKKRIWKWFVRVGTEEEKRKGKTKNDCPGVRPNDK